MLVITIIFAVGLATTHFLGIFLSTVLMRFLLALIHIFATTIFWFHPEVVQSLYEKFQEKQSNASLLSKIIDRVLEVLNDVFTAFAIYKITNCKLLSLLFLATTPLLFISKESKLAKDWFSFEYTYFGLHVLILGYALASVA